MKEPTNMLEAREQLDFATKLLKLVEDLDGIEKTEEEMKDLYVNVNARDLLFVAAASLVGAGVTMEQGDTKDALAVLEALEDVSQGLQEALADDS